MTSTVQQSSRLWTQDESSRAEIDEMLRVDHAGEVGAVRIYEGQMWVLRGTPVYDQLVVCKEVYSGSINMRYDGSDVVE